MTILGIPHDPGPVSRPPTTRGEQPSGAVTHDESPSSYAVEETIVGLFEAQVARTPREEAVRAGERRMTYRELDERANQMAAHLRTFGVGPDLLVALYMEHSIEVVCAILGVLKTGAAYVPIDPACPRERVAFMLRDIGEGSGGRKPVVVTNPSLASALPEGAMESIILTEDFASIGHHPALGPRSRLSPQGLAYVIYTSGSTGRPKGVMIEHRSLVNYISWANAMYVRGERLAWPLFSSLAFDLTVTSIFTPLVAGGRIVVPGGQGGMRGMAIRQVIEDNAVEIVKLTPAHLALIKDMDLGASRIRRLIVGGEDLKTDLARQITLRFGRPVEIYNEYGPTEATVGCMIHRYDPERDLGPSVPIGVPAANTLVYILDEQRRSVPAGSSGEMYVGGHGLARGYFHQPELTSKSFLTLEMEPGGQATPLPALRSRAVRVYRTGDIARMSAGGRMEFLGRADHQVKIGGARIELGEIEARLSEHPAVEACVVDTVTVQRAGASPELQHCAHCGLASSLPGIRYDDGGVCSICRAYDTYKDKAQAYFKSRGDLTAMVAEMKAARRGGYDCLVLLSGGKDSTYMLYQLCALGLTPLVFTLDNGFISEEAKANIRRVVKSLGVELVVGGTPHMNEIFVDSLRRFANVCNGCFKTIYTLATNLAHEKDIRYIVTGLSRGQFFETRLTEDLFLREDFDAARLDALVLEARKAYHRRQDAVSSYLEVDIFRGDAVFQDIQFVDFYRYWSASLDEIYAFLTKCTPWVRPSDTGRSTNCLINEVGIYVHKKQRGFHNYSLPYSWDVRLGQKTRAEAMAELDDEIDEGRVKGIMAQIGYTEPAPAAETDTHRLAAYYVSKKPQPSAELRAHLGRWLPDYMVPTLFTRVPQLPLTPNGKIDRAALRMAGAEPPPADRALTGPRTETERALAAIWSELLNVERIGIHDDFFDLGGQSLGAIRAVSRIRDVFGVDLVLRHLIEHPTLAGLAEVIEGMAWGGGSRPERAAARDREEIVL